MGNSNEIKQGELLVGCDFDQDVEVAVGTMIPACPRTKYGEVSYAVRAKRGLQTTKSRQYFMTALIGDAHTANLPDLGGLDYSAAFCP